MKGVEGENAKLKGEVEAVVVAGGSVARGPSAMSESSAFSDTRVEDMEREELEKKLTKLKRDGRAAREMVKRLQARLQFKPNSLCVVARQGQPARPTS
jgi:hypothetical protein